MKGNKLNLFSRKLEEIRMIELETSKND